jgi:hypothetical protein
MQTDLCGDVQCCYCLDKECFEKQVAKKAEEIRKDYIKQGFEEVPEEDVDEAEYGYGDYLDAETDDEDEQKTIEKLKSEGVKPMFWVNAKKADHGLVYHITGSDDEDCDDDDEQREPEDTNSWTFIINHMDWKRRDKVKKAASAEEKRIVADKIQSVFGLISKTAKAFILEICNREYEAENGDTETYLKHQSEASCDFLEEVADSLVSEWSGVNDDIREFLEMDSREELERNAAAAIPEDDAEEPDEDNLENED